jgi:hypothetical protein
MPEFVVTVLQFRSIVSCASTGETSMPDSSVVPAITLGTTDAKMIMRGERGKLWRIKRGLEQPEDLTWKLPVQMGLLTEALNRRFYEHDYGRPVIPPEAAAFVAQMREIGIPVRWNDKRVPIVAEVSCKSEPRFTAHPDGLVEIDGQWGLWEGKHTDAISGWNEAESVVHRNWWQFVHQMMVTNLPWVEVSVIYGSGNDRKAFRIVRDMDEETILRAALLEFLRDWEKGVEPPDQLPIQTEPVIGPGGGAKRVKKYTETQLHSLPCANWFAERAAEFVANKDAAKTFETAKKALKEALPEDGVSLTAHGVVVKANVKGAISIDIVKEKARASA